MPSTTRAAVSRTRHLLDVHVEIGRNFLYIVELFELLEQPDQRLRVFALDVDGGLGDMRDLRLHHRETRRLESLLHCVERMRIGRHDKLIALCLEIFRARFERCLEHGVFVVPGPIEVDLPLTLEEVRHRMTRAEVAAKSAEAVSNVGDGAGWIVGERENEDRNAARAVALVRDLSIGDSLEITRALLYRALNVLLRHRLRFRGVDRGAKTRISGWITTAELRRHRDLANELGELRTALGVSRGLVML